MSSKDINNHEGSQGIFNTNPEEISQESYEQATEVKLKPKGVKVIYGEKAVFKALSKAVQNAKDFVCSTRLSNHPLDLKKNHLEEFANSLRHVHTRSDPISDSLKRIIVVNSNEKRQGVDDLLNIKGKLYLYLMTPTDNYNFEIVIIDNIKAFVLYRDKNTEPSDLCSYAFCCENDAFVQKEILLFSQLTKQAEEQEKIGAAMIIEKNEDTVIIKSKGSKTEGSKLKAMEEVKKFFEDTLMKQNLNENNYSSGLKMGNQS